MVIIVRFMIHILKLALHTRLLLHNMILAIHDMILVLGLRKPPADPSLDPAFDPSTAEPAPRLEASPPAADKRAFFGDLHIHTALSADAWVFGVRATY